MSESHRAFELLQAGDHDGLVRLLEEDPESSDARDATGVSLLMQCLYRGQHDLAESIASKKKALDIFETASLGRLDRLAECMRDGTAINSRSTDGFTSLHFACFFKQPKATKVLIHAGAAVDAVAGNPTKVMPLHSAAAVRNLEAARLLLDHGAPVDARQQGGWVPLHAAAQNGDLAMVELLLERGSNPKLTNDEGKTPAIVAREAGHSEIAEFLDGRRSSASS
jgi:ankyrin repeat protein